MKLSKIIYNLEAAFPVFIYLCGPVAGWALREGYYTAVLVLFALTWGGYILEHVALDENTQNLKRAKSNLYTIEKKYYLESQAHKVAHDLLTRDQWSEYYEIIKSRHLSDYNPYEYQEFEPWKYELDNK